MFFGLVSEMIVVIKEAGACRDDSRILLKCDFSEETPSASNSARSSLFINNEISSSTW